MVVVAIGAIAETVAVALTPARAGNVTAAFWPTVTDPMSASAMFAVTVIFDTSAMVANPDVVVLVPDAAAEELLPPDVFEPTEPFTATTSPAIGEVSVAPARFASAVARAFDALLTCDCAELTCASAFAVVWAAVWLLDGLVGAGLSRLVLASASCASASFNWACAALTAFCSVVEFSVASVAPAATVWPTATDTLAIVPETGNAAVASLTGAIDPLAVTVLLTTPLCTVPVSWVPLTADAGGGLMTKYAPTTAATTTTANDVLTTTGRVNLMCRNWTDKL